MEQQVDTVRSEDRQHEEEPNAFGLKLRKIADRATALSPAMGDGDVKNQLEGMDRNQQAVLIGNHAKSVLQSATGSSRMMIRNLMDELQALDNLVANNEDRLMSEIDNHVDLSIGAVKAAEVLSQSIKVWEEKLRPLHSPIGSPYKR